MSEKPILFSGPMVRAILDGRKTVTRRVLDPRSGILTPEILARPDCRIAHEGAGGLVARWGTESYGPLRCPYGAPGDRLWVRETWCGNQGDVRYRADGDSTHRSDAPPRAIARRLAKDFPEWRWRSPRYMPRWASRLTLEVTDVRVERVQDISHHDALAEGVAYNVSKPDGAPVPRFRALWNAINAKRGFGWDSDPWVWVISFRRVEEDPARG